MKRPTLRAQRGLYSLVRNTQSLAQEEAEWIHHSRDLAALSLGTEHGWFNDFLEDTMNAISFGMTKVSMSQNLRTADFLIARIKSIQMC